MSTDRFENETEMSTSEIKAAIEILRNLEAPNLSESCPAEINTLKMYLEGKAKAEEAIVALTKIERSLQTTV